MVTTASSITQGTAGTAAQRQSLATDFDQFLRLLTTQLQNQDPLSPMDSNEFTNQLVQFSQVEQQINTNEKLNSLLSLQQSSAISSALGYVGLNAYYEGNTFPYDGTGEAYVDVTLESVPEDVKLTLLDKKGNKVLSIPLEKDTSTQTYKWDGTDQYGNKMDAGSYTVRIDAYDSNEDPVKSTVNVNGKVAGIETEDGQVYLMIGDQSISLEKVIKAIL
jgi:flagellar basal-body rod modification protein FlgD